MSGTPGFRLRKHHRVLIPALVVLTVFLTASKCAEKSGTITGSNVELQGKHVGSWEAPGGKKCKWKKTLTNKQHVTILLASGKGNTKQRVNIYHSDVGGHFTSTNCGSWS